MRSANFDSFRVAQNQLLKCFEYSLDYDHTFESCNGFYLLYLIHQLDEEPAFEVHQAIPSWQYQRCIEVEPSSYATPRVALSKSDIYHSYLRRLFEPRRVFEYRAKSAQILELAKTLPQEALAQAYDEDRRYQHFLLGAIAIHANPTLWETPGAVLNILKAERTTFSDPPGTLHTIYLLEMILRSRNPQLQERAKGLIRQLLVEQRRETSQG